jgi:hypothetical protein
MRNFFSNKWAIFFNFKAHTYYVTLSRPIYTSLDLQELFIFPDKNISHITDLVQGKDCNTRPYTYIYIHTCVHTYIHAYTHTYTCSYVHTYTYTRTHARVYTRTHVHTYIHTYMHTHIDTSQRHSYSCLVSATSLKVIHELTGCWLSVHNTTTFV